MAYTAYEGVLREEEFDNWLICKGGQRGGQIQAWKSNLKLLFLDFKYLACRRGILIYLPKQLNIL